MSCARQNLLVGYLLSRTRKATVGIYRHSRSDDEDVLYVGCLNARGSGNGFSREGME